MVRSLGDFLNFHVSKDLPEGVGAVMLDHKGEVVAVFGESEPVPDYTIPMPEPVPESWMIMTIETMHGPQSYIVTQPSNFRRMLDLPFVQPVRIERRDEQVTFNIDDTQEAGGVPDIERGAPE